MIEGKKKESKLGNSNSTNLVLVLCHQGTIRKARLRSGSVGNSGAKEEGYREEGGNFNISHHFILLISRFLRKLEAKIRKISKL